MKRTFLGIVFALLVTLSPSAHAGVYDVALCTSGADAAWTAMNTSPQTLSVISTCPAATQQGQGLVVSDSLGALDTGPGASASWTLSSPPSTYLTRLHLHRSIGNWYDWEAAIVAADGTVLESCPVVSIRCERGGPPSMPASSVVLSGLRTSRVSFRVRCTAAETCANGFQLHRASVTVYGGTATIEDPVPPVVAAISGSFADAGWHKSKDTVTVSATDASGVKQLRIVAGGVEVARQDQACDYSRMRPCPESMDGTLVFDTARVPDGTHELQAIATDAAEQPGVGRGTLRVDRHAPGAPVDLNVTAADDGTYDVKWTNPSQGTAAPIVAAHYAVCDPAPALTCQPAQRVAGGSIAKIGGVKVSGKGSLRLWLEDEAGNVEPGNSSVAPVDPGLRTNPRVLDTNPPVLLPSGPVPASQLKIAKARRSGSTLTISGTIARGASARITAQVARSKAGKALASGRTSPRGGKWSVKVRLPASMRAARTIYVAVSFAGQDNFRKTTLKRKLSRRAASGGSTSTEFSVETGR